MDAKNNDGEERISAIWLKQKIVFQENWIEGMIITGYGPFSKIKVFTVIQRLQGFPIGCWTLSKGFKQIASFIVLGDRRAYKRFRLDLDNRPIFLIWI